MSKKISICIPIVLTIMGLIFLIRSCAHANEFDVRPPTAWVEIQRLRPYFKSIGSYDDKVNWYEEYQWHLLQANITLEEAKERCWWLPNVSDRDRARQCFTAAMAAIGHSSLTGRAISSLTALLVNHGLDCLNEWEYIESKLAWCEYHTEMAEWYSYLLN